MAASKRMSQSFAIEPPQIVTEPDGAQQWVADWQKVSAKGVQNGAGPLPCSTPALSASSRAH
jgi:hypothetical protein